MALWDLRCICPVLGCWEASLGGSPIAPKVAVAISTLPLPWGILALIFGLGIMFSEVFINWMEGHRPVIEAQGVGGFIMYLVQAFMDLFETLISQLSNTLSLSVWAPLRWRMAV